MALAGGMVLAGVPAASAAEATTSAPALTSRYGGTIISGRSWLQGRGVDVLRGRQCTDLALRLYARQRWGPLDNIYGLRPGRLYGGAVVFYRNGSGYKPVPGDVVVELGGSYQHVAVVSKVTRRAIHTVEQNAVPWGRHVYGWNGRFATGAYRPRHVGGFIHSRRNRIGLPPKPPKARPAVAPAVT